MARLAYLAVALLSLGAHVLAGPVTQDPVLTCSTVRCVADHKCLMMDGKPRCRPLTGPVCGPSQCADVEACCNESCGICTLPGQPCPMIGCPAPTFSTLAGPAPLPTNDAARKLKERQNACGSKVCPEDQVCCNASCGICTPPGGMCIQQACLPANATELGAQCGPTRCEASEVCCNDSCGICTPPDGACTMQVCSVASKRLF